MKKPNIILIVADTMRRDAVGVYNDQIKTPNLLKLAKDSVIYNNAISPSSWTIPSHASLFTGKYVNEHRFHEEKSNKNLMLLNHSRFIQLKTIAQRLSEREYTSMARVQNAAISADFGFDRGFESYELDTGFHDYKNVLQNYFTDIEIKYIYEHDTYKLLKLLLKEKKFRQIKVLANVYLDRLKTYSTYLDNYLKSVIAQNDVFSNISIKIPYFSFFNIMYMHEPYIKKELKGFLTFCSLFGLDILTNKEKKMIRDVYYTRSKLIDNFVGNMLSFIENKDDYDNTMVIFTSDHGQSLFENKYYGHGLFLYDELIQIPLIIKYPGYISYKGYSNSLISLLDINDIIEKTLSNSPILYSKGNEFVFSESFGSPHDLASFKQSRKYKTKINKMISNGRFELIQKQFDVKRKAVLYDNYKLVMNELGETEEFTYKGSVINVDDNRRTFNYMLDGLKIFTGNEQYNFPK